MSKYLKEKFQEIFNMTCKLDEFITAVDLFGQGINLRLHSRIKSKTVLGGYLTITTVVLLTSMFYNSFQDVWNRTNPQVSVEQIVTSEYPNITLDLNSMPISVALTNNNNYVINKPRYFKFFANFRYGLTTNPNLIEKRLNLIACKKDYFPKLSNETYESLNMNQNLCLENQNVTIAGSWSNDYISYLTLGISLCINKTQFDNCAPYSEILDFIKITNYFWNVFFQNTNINPQKAVNPVTYNIFSVYRGINLDIFKTSEIFIRNQQLNSDEGLFTSTNNTLSYLGYDYNVVDDGSKSDESLVEFNFLVSYNKFIYHRKYLKVQNLLASVGGLASVIRIICIVICYIFSVIKRDEKILNKIFDYDLSEINHLYAKRNLKLNTCNNIGGNSNLKIESRVNSVANSQAHFKREETIINNMNNIKNPFINSNTLKKLNDFDLNSRHYENNNILPKEEFENSLTKRKHMLFNNFLIPDKLSTSKISKNMLSYRSGKFQNSSINKSFNSININDNHRILNLSTPIISNTGNPGNTAENKSCGKQEDKEIEFRTEKIEEAGGRKLEMKKINHKNKNNLNDLNDLNVDNDEVYKGLANTEQIQSTQRIEKPHANKHVQFEIVEPDEEKQFKLKFSKPKQIINFMSNSKRRYELKFSSFDILKGFLCCCFIMDKNLRLKKELYTKSKFAIDQFLDITFIIRKLEEFEKFKLVMFSTEQMALFNFIAKEIMSLNEKALNSHNMNILKAFDRDEENLAEIIIKFREKIDKNCKINEIDTKLYNLLNEGLRKFA